MNKMGLVVSLLSLYGAVSAPQFYKNKYSNTSWEKTKMKGLSSKEMGTAGKKKSRRKRRGN